MPDKKTPTQTLSATLELAGSVRLSGELKSIDEGGLHLLSTRAVDAVSRSANFKISVGESAVLNLGTLRDSIGFIGCIEVTISKVEGTSIQLELIDENGDLEKRCVNLLPNSNDEDPGQGHSPDLSHYPPDECLRVLQQQSVSSLEELSKDYLIDLCNQSRLPLAKTSIMKR